MGSQRKKSRAICGTIEARSKTRSDFEQSADLTACVRDSNLGKKDKIMERRKIVAGNWKMNMTPSQAVKLVEEFKAAGSK